MKPTVISCLSLFALCSCGLPSKPNPALCELAPNREEYAGQKVTVEGILLVSYHGSVVVEPRCDMGIGIEWFDDDLPWMREFDAIAERSQTETMMARVRATGIVKQKPHPDMTGGRPWYLDLTAAKVVEAYPIAKAHEGRFERWRSGLSPEPFRPSR